VSLVDELCIPHFCSSTSNKESALPSRANICWPGNSSYPDRQTEAYGKRKRWQQDSNLALETRQEGILEDRKLTLDLPVLWNLLVFAEEVRTYKTQPSAMPPDLEDSLNLFMDEWVLVLAAESLT
jgi:hypothetical protein